MKKLLGLSRTSRANWSEKDASTHAETSAKELRTTRGLSMDRSSEQTDTGDAVSQTGGDSKPPPSPTSSFGSNLATSSGSNASASAMTPGASATNSVVAPLSPRRKWDQLYQMSSKLLGAEAKTSVRGRLRHLVRPRYTPIYWYLTTRDLPNAQVFYQNVEILMHDMVFKMKFISSQIMRNALEQKELDHLCDSISIVEAKVLENGDKALATLRTYFQTDSGVNLCEHTLLPNVITDYMESLRIQLLREHLRRLCAASAPPEVAATTPTQEDSTSASSETSALLVKSMEFLVTCMQAITCNAALMDKFRCEMSNLVLLVAEQYAPSMTFLRESAERMVNFMAEKIFSAALVWYLHDACVISLTVKLIDKISEAKAITCETSALAALNAMKATAAPPFVHQTGSMIHDLAATAAAVSDALLLTRKQEDPVKPKEINTDQDPESFRLDNYDPLVGLKCLVMLLQRACRFSMVLLGEFQSSGGYELLTKLIEASSSEMQAVALINLLLLLLPLGTGFVPTNEELNQCTAFACGARNVGAFSAIRDVLLNCIDTMSEPATTTPIESPSNTDPATVSKEQLALQLLTTVLQIYSCDYENFVCLEPKTETLAQILKVFGHIKSYEARVLVLRIVEYVCNVAKPGMASPKSILSILCSLFVEHVMTETQQLLSSTSPASDEDQTPQKLTLDAQEDFNSFLSLALCCCVVRILQNAAIASAYRDELSCLGLLERGVYAALVKISSVISTDRSARRIQVLFQFRIHLNLWSSLTCLMLRGNLHLCSEFRQLAVHQLVYSIADVILLEDAVWLASRPSDFHGCYSPFSVFSICVELACVSLESLGDCTAEQVDLLRAGSESDLTKMLELVQHFRGNAPRQSNLLEILKHMVRGNLQVLRAWRSCQGNEILVSILSSLQHLDKPTAEASVLVKLLDWILDILSVILDPKNGDAENRAYFKTSIGYQIVSSCLINCGVLRTDHLTTVINHLFEMITGLLPPKNKIRNADAVQIVFMILPHLESSVALATLDRLYSKLMSNDDLSISRKKQATQLVEAGAFRWLMEPTLVRLLQKNKEVRDMIMKFIATLSRDELSTIHLRELFRVIGSGMPRLLSSDRGTNEPQQVDGWEEDRDVGLIMLDMLTKGSNVPQVHVGAYGMNRSTSGYLQVVNNADKVWPPSSGYSFACWLRFPAYCPQGDESVATRSASFKDNSVCSVALCEGSLRVSLLADDSEASPVFCVLVGTSLSLFPTSQDAREGENVINTYEVTAVAPSAEFEFCFWSNETQFTAKCNCAEEFEMWFRALQQAEILSKRNSLVRQNSGSLSDSEDALVVTSDLPLNSSSSLEGYACIFSVYSIDNAGCFTRVYFDRVTGCLKVDTGSVTSGPNMNLANAKRTSVIFKNVDMNLLRQAIDSRAVPAGGVQGNLDSYEKLSHWHHVVITHRKVVMGSSLLTLYIDGSEVASKKLNYPSAPSSGAAQCFLGKDVQMCGSVPALPWSLGPTWFTEEILSSNAVTCMFLLGPSFAGQFTGVSYHAAGDWHEAIATSLLDRITKRRVEVSRAAKRMQLAKLGRACRRQWNETAEASTSMSLASLAEAVKKEEFARTKDHQHSKQMAFLAFVKYECSMNTLGSEILSLLSSFRLSEEQVIFSTNTRFGLCGKQTNINVQYIGTEKQWPFDLPRILPSLGGVTRLFLPLIDRVCNPKELALLLKLLCRSLRQNAVCLAEFLEINGFALLSKTICDRVALVNDEVLRALVRFAAGPIVEDSRARGRSSASTTSSGAGVGLSPKGFPLILNYYALSQLVLCWEMLRRMSAKLHVQLVRHLMTLIDLRNPNAIFNCRQLRRANLITWIIWNLSELCSEKTVFDAYGALENRCCYPSFEDPDKSNLLQHLLMLLHTFLRVENHADDINSIAEVILLSLLNETAYPKGTCLRVVLLQFLVAEVEQDTSGVGKDSSNQEPLVSTILETTLARTQGSMTTKKRKTLAADVAIALSPTSTSSGSANGAGSNAFRVESFENVLLEVIAKTESGPFFKIEALLATRLLLSLAQVNNSFAVQLLRGVTLHKVKRVLRVHSANLNLFIPILAFVSNIPMHETKYHDMPKLNLENGYSGAQFALPSACAFAMEKPCIKEAWDLLGSQLVQNCQLKQPAAMAINIQVIAQLSFQIEMHEAFFSSMCQCASSVLRMCVDCLLCCEDDRFPWDSQLQSFLTCSVTGNVTANGGGRSCAFAVACFDMIRIFMSRSLFEKEDFAEHMICLLERFDVAIQDKANTSNPQSASDFITKSLPDAQKCWLAFFVQIVKSTKALSDNGSFLVLRNICGLSIALSRYLVDEKKHQGSASVGQLPGTTSDLPVQDSQSPTGATVASSAAASSCFGTDVLIFFLSAVRLCSEQSILNLVGPDDQQYFYGVLVYCAQTVVLNELNGFHKNSMPSKRLLECIVTSKHLLIQQTKCSSVIVCGLSNQQENTSANPITRMRSLSTTAHKEFGIGAESDRSFILCLAAELFCMLLEDCDCVQQSSTLLWQFLLQQRMGVLKELLIVEPRASLLQNITANKKEVVDVYHGGFDRLLHVIAGKATASATSTSAAGLIAGNGGSGSSPSELEVESRECWLQFQGWLHDNYDLLKDLIVTRTEPIFKHFLEVLSDCSVVRKANVNHSSTTPTAATTSRSLSQAELSINISFIPSSEAAPIPDSAKSEELAIGYKAASRKTLLKFINMKEGALHLMQDAYLHWKEIEAPMRFAKDVWDNTPRHQLSGRMMIEPGRENDKPSKELVLDRSIYQYYDSPHRMDFTEGPCRMRMRMLRDMDKPITQEDAPCNNNAPLTRSGTAITSTKPTVDTPPDARFTKALEFHEAVETYRELVPRCAKGEPMEKLVTELWSRCKYEKTKVVFQLHAPETLISKGSSSCTPAETNSSTRSSTGSDRSGAFTTAELLPFARRIFDAFFPKDQVAGTIVSPGVISHIEAQIKALESAVASADEACSLPQSLFDVADSETMQNSLCSSKKGDAAAAARETTPIDEPDSDDDEQITSSAVKANDSEEDDDETDVKESGRKSTSSPGAAGDVSGSKISDHDKKQAGDRQGDANETLGGDSIEERMLESSYDYVYGGVARFLKREDYPPLRAYNAVYIVGMARIAGVFLICRHAIYFIGGYCKMLSEVDSSTTTGNPSSSDNSGTPVTTPASSSSTFSFGPVSPGKFTMGKKKTKNLIRDTLADLSLQLHAGKLSSSSANLSFTIVPLALDQTDDLQRWSVNYAALRQFHRIRYQLRSVAIEYFDLGGSTFFVQYESNGEREEILKVLFSMPIVNSIFWNPLLRSSAFSSSLKKLRQALTKKWLRGAVSNFEYLVSLNTLAGRSFNDITQYPVFPWVLRDYQSEYLDLDNKEVYRDLTKPMGALGSNRAIQFQERYNAMCSDGMPGSPMDTPAFHYGTHYSCSAYVVNYLIRLLPFTRLALELQGGCFDHADRLFRSIRASWESASTENLQDVRELIPEFYYLPEFLLNANSFDLGTTQSGEKVSHVILPKWAHNDPREFVRLQRRALESKFVSENLHSWIDLIFGVKQTGEEAVKAQNVFMHITYEGTVDIDAITDPVMREATLSQIENFGQTPSRLFNSPHPQRKVPTLAKTANTNTSANVTGASNDKNDNKHEPTNSASAIEAYIKWHTPLAPALVSIGKDYVLLKKMGVTKALDEAIGDVKLVNDKLQCRAVGCSFVPPRFSKYIDWKSPDGLIKFRIHQGSTARNREANKVIGMIEGAHNSRVKCAAFSDDGSILVTGGEDAVVNLVECSKSNGQRVFKQLVKLVGHEDSVISVAINKEFNLIASGSMDCSVILWDLRCRLFVRELQGHLGPIIKVNINGANGNVVTTTSSEIRVWSINGDLLAATSTQLHALNPITSAISTRCDYWQNGVVAITGHSNGTIALWGLLYPSDIEKEKQDAMKNDVPVTGADSSKPSTDTSAMPAAPVGINKATSMKAITTRLHARICSLSSANCSSASMVKVLPLCQLYIMKLLMDHRSNVTALAMSTDQRQLFSGDSEGNCIRWVDDSSMSLNAM